MTKRATLTFIIAPLLLAALAVGCGTEPEPAADLLPEISGTTYEHGPFQLTEQTGRPLVVNFWYPSCPPCAQELPDFQAAYESYQDQVDFVGVFLPVLDTEQAARDFLQREDIGVGYPNLTDSVSDSAVLAYSIVSFPTTLFINADRTEVQRRYVGGPIPLQELETLIDDLLAAG